jgi:hypothetical protein
MLMTEVGLTPSSTNTFRANQPSFVTQFISLHATLELVIFHRSQDLNPYARKDFSKSVILRIQILPYVLRGVSAAVFGVLNIIVTTVNPGLSGSK